MPRHEPPGHQRQRDETGASLSGCGGTDYTVNGIYSADFGGSYHTDLNLAATRFCLSDADMSRYQLPRPRRRR
jgi:hypothetical protein